MLSVLFLLALLSEVKLLPTPPEIYVDQGACPFECCQYGEWTARRPAPAYAEPVDGTQPVATIMTGTKILAITGEVRTKAGRFVVKKEQASMRPSANGAVEPYKPGDVVYVYTYLGEGGFKVWFKGEMYAEGIGFSPYGGSAGRRGEEGVDSWGELETELQSVWWVKAKLPNGRIVWLRDPSSFDGMDACG
jgi:hypothetical protein